MNIGFRNAGKFYQFTITFFLVYLLKIQSYKGFPRGSAGKESTYNEGDLGSNPWVRKIPWGSERLPTPVFWPGEFPGPNSPWGRKESDTTEQRSLHFTIHYLNINKNVIPFKVQKIKIK